MARISDVIADGVAIIEQKPERPPYFSDVDLERARELANPVGDEVRAISLRRPSRPSRPRPRRIQVTKRLVANVDELIGPRLESFGTVEGTLEAVTIHGRRAFYIWDQLSGRRVECFFGDRITLEDILAAFWEEGRGSRACA
jgi:hypothetical protein